MNARSRALFFLLLLAAAAALIPFLGYLTDDTFIHLQFAKHLMQGKGFSFNAGEPTYGATSPLWVLLLTVTAKALHLPAAAPIDPSVTPAIATLAKVLGGLFHLLGVIALVLTGKRLGWDDRTSLALGALLAVQSWTTRWAVSGMETPLAIACAAFALHGMAGVLVRGRAAWTTGLWLGLAALARPECCLLLAIVVAAVASGAERGIRRSLEAMAGAAAVLLPWILTAWTWFHRLLPNTAAAKAGALFHPGLFVAAVHAIFQVELAADALPLALFVLVLAFGSAGNALPATRGRRAFWIACAAWPVLLWLSFGIQGVQVVSRYVLPATPCVLLIGMASFRWVIVGGLLPIRYGAALAGFLGLFLLQNALFTAFVSAPSTRAHTSGLRDSLVAIGIWARDHTPRDAFFAVADIGAFGYYSERRVLDLYGLVTPVMAPIVVRDGYDTVVWRAEFEAAGRPQYLVDRSHRAGRLASDPDEPTPYKLLFTRRIANLGITRPGGFYYSVYSIDWKVADEMREHVAGALPEPGKRRIM